VLQYVAVCVAVCCRELHSLLLLAVCQVSIRVLQYVALYYRVLQGAAMSIAVGRVQGLLVLQCVLQCVAVRCSALQGAAVCNAFGRL